AVGMRHRAAAILDHLKVFKALLWARSRLPLRGRFPILCHHHLRELDPDHPFDAGVVDGASFDEQMTFVSRHFTPIGIDQLRAPRNGGAPPENAVVVTFDGVYRSNLELAVPILKKHGFRAISSWPRVISANDGVSGGID